jgi:hypothetical protein
LRVFRLLLFGLFRKIFFADVVAVADAEHHDDVVGFFPRENIARDMPPIEVALDVVAQQAGIIFVLAVDGDFRLVSERIFKPVGQPVRHAVADDHDGGRRGDAGGRLARARRAGMFGAAFVLRLVAAVAGITE